MNREEYMRTFKEIVHQMVDLVEQKNGLYARDGDPFSNLRLASEVSNGRLRVEDTIYTRMCDKMQRVANLIGGADNKSDESVDDSLMDLANYAIIMLLWLRSNRKGPGVIPTDNPQTCSPGRYRDYLKEFAIDKNELDPNFAYGKLSIEEEVDGKIHMVEGENLRKLKRDRMLKSFTELFNDHKTLSDLIFDKGEIEYSLDHLRNLSRTDRLSVNGPVAYWLSRVCTAMEDEVRELRESIPWKWWRGEKVDIENVRVELIDIFHFLMTAAMISGMTGEDFIHTYYKKRDLNFMRQKVGFKPGDNEEFGIGKLS